jgi:hypothetical protein
MIRRLVLVPFGLLLAIAAGVMALAVAALLDPALSGPLANALALGAMSLVDALLAHEDPGPVIEPVASGLARLAFALFVAPPVFSALACELVGTRRLLAHAGLAALLAAAAPFLLRGSGRGATPEEVHVAAVLALVGAAAGAVYWSAAGRTAGLQRDVPRILSAKAENSPANE